MTKCFNCQKTGQHKKSYVTLDTKICDDCFQNINHKIHSKTIWNNYLKYKKKKGTN